MANPIPAEGYPATILDEETGILGIEGSKEKEATGPDPISIDYEKYSGPTGNIARNYQENSFSRQNPEWEGILERYYITGDDSEAMLYSKNVQARAKDLEDLGVSAYEAEEMVRKADSPYNIPYNQDIIRVRKRLETSIDPDQGIISRDGKDYILLKEGVETSTLGAYSQYSENIDGLGTVIPLEGPVRDLFFFDKSQLIEPTDWRGAADKHSPVIIKSGSTTEKPGSSGNIVTSSSGQTIDTDRMLFNIGLQLFSSSARQAYETNPEDDADAYLPADKQYVLNPMSASMAVELLPDVFEGEKNYMNLVGKKISGDDANKLMKAFAETATEGVVESSVWSRRLEGSGGINIGFGAGGSRKKYNMSALTDQTDTPVTTGKGQSRTEETYQIQLGKSQGFTFDKKEAEDAIKGYISNWNITKDTSGNYSISVGYNTNPPATEYFESKGNEAVITDPQPVGEKPKEEEKTQEAKSVAEGLDTEEPGTEKKKAPTSASVAGKEVETKRLSRYLTLNEMNRFRALLGYKSLAEMYRDQQDIGAKHIEMTASSAAQNLSEELEEDM